MTAPESTLPHKLARWLQSNRQRLTTLVVDAHAKHAPSEVERSRGILLENTEQRLDCLCAAVLVGSPALFLDNVAWSKVVLATRGLRAQELSHNTAALREVLDRSLEGALRDLAIPLLDEAARAVPTLPSDLRGPVYEASPRAELCARYLEALLAADHRGASAMIVAATRNGTPVSEIYLQVLMVTQYEIGRLWQTNRISVAQEHYCTAVAQQIMARLHSWIFGSRRAGRRVLVSAVAGEMHALGAHMLADFFEMAGWDGYFVGASTPLPAVLAAIVEQHVDLVAISATMTPHVMAVLELVRGIRADPQAASVPILVGGYPFNLIPNLWRVVGANGTASSPGEAVELGQVLGEKRVGLAHNLN